MRSLPSFAASLLCLSLCGLSCSEPRAVSSPFLDPKLAPERRVNDLIRRMNPDEKLALLRGARSMAIRANDRLGIPDMHVVNGAMGISARDAAGKPIPATAFPANIGMAATWNPELLEKQGAVIAQQARALGRGQILGPIVDISRSVLSGRVFEDYGEDPLLASRIITGFVTGAQGEGIIATAIYRGGEASERASREFDLRPLEVAVSEAGVWSVMPGLLDPSGGLVRDFLERRLAFRGFPVFSKGQQDDVSAYSPEAVDDRVRGVLRAMFASGAFDMDGSTKSELEIPAHRAVSRAAATESIVLLRNENGLLPLDRSKVHSIAVFGPNAAVNRMASGNYTVATAASVTPLDALRATFGAGVKLGSSSPAEAVSAARAADIAIVFAGTGAATEAEGVDRTSIDLPAGQDELIGAVANANPRTIVVLTNGSPVAMGKWLRNVPAVLEAWFPGEEGGSAIVDVLSGVVNPSGRLPVTFPARIEDLSGGDAGLFSGYRHFDHNAIQPLFPFGFGLAYTKFEYSGLNVTPGRVRMGQFVEVSLTVRNAGSRAGKETVQLYIHANDPEIEQPVQELRAFQQVELNPGEARRIHFTLTESATSHFDEKRQDWLQDQGVFEVRVGSSSRDIRTRGTFSVYE